MFENLPVEEQCVVLNEILHLFQCKPVGADLSLIGEGKSVGNLKSYKFISGCKSVIMVNQSVTGLFKQETDLLKV